MAPTPTNIQPTSTSSPTMSNPNTHALAMAIRNCSNASSSASRMRVVYIGKEQQPINLSEMVSINSHSWKKAASFGTLMDSVSSLVDSHTVADIVAMVSNEIPIDSGAALQEAQSAAQLIAGSVLNPQFLEPVAFLTSTGNEANLGDPDDMENREVDITYVRFRCSMHGSSVDSRVVNAPDLSFHFCLRLPQHTYDEATGDITLLVNAPSCSAKSPNPARDLLSTFSARDSSTTTPNTSTPSGSTAGTSPAMTRF